MLTPFLVISAIAAAVTAYGVGRLIAFTHMTKPLKIGTTAVMCLAVVGHFFLLFNETDFTRETLADWVPVTALFVTLGFLFFLVSLVRDIITGVRAPYRRSRGLEPVGRDIFSLILAGVCTLVALVFSVTGTWTALSEPYVEEMKVTVKRLPAELEGRRVAQITDLHASSVFPRERTEAIVKLVNEAKPDLILFTGDLADGDRNRREFDVEPLAGLKSTYGVYGITGNHEYPPAQADASAKLFQTAGIKLLQNETVTLDVKGKKVTVVGLPDGAAARAGLDAPDLAKALSGVSAADLRILLDHRPGNAEANSNPQFGIDLQLSGHTHGGQMGILSGLVAAFNGGFVKGFYTLGNMTLYVSQGTAMWPGLTVRTGTWNEIPVFTLSAK